jgi:hypothetical protein
VELGFATEVVEGVNAQACAFDMDDKTNVSVFSVAGDTSNQNREERQGGNYNRSFEKGPSADRGISDYRSR